MHVVTNTGKLHTFEVNIHVILNPTAHTSHSNLASVIADRSLHLGTPYAVKKDHILCSDYFLSLGSNLKL